MTNQNPLRVTIAGASGFVGKNLIKTLLKRFKVKALSRQSKESENPNLKWHSVDLFSLHSTHEALKDTDVAIYLVHSMMPSSRLFQGSFHDTDLMLADNFVKACQSNNVKQIIYLGGLVPKGRISAHLESRREVEEVLASTQIPLTVLRAGMVVGEGGSSFEILRNLVFNLPGMILPKWTEAHTQAIFIEDLVRIFDASIGNLDFFSKTLDIVNGENLRYKELIIQTAAHFKKKRILIPVPIDSTSFSKLWVSLFGNTEYELVSPLIDSLLCDLPQVDPDPLIRDLIYCKTYKSMLEKLPGSKSKRAYRHQPKSTDNTVRSIQRLKSGAQFNVDEISEKYMNWLPQHLSPFIKVTRDGDTVHFCSIGISKPLLSLKLFNEQHEVDRIKFHIIGGLLSKTKNTGWLEFRRVANGNYMLSSINDFIPSLPWYVYKMTQAPIHAWVMKCFNLYLSK